jgi:acyl-CoA synthetase (AMP-forming)/AMP-acid ligase II
MMENHPRYLEVTWAAQRSGLYYTALSSRLTAGEVEYILNDCGAKAFVTSYALRDAAAEVLDRIPGVHTKLMVGGVIAGYEPYEDATAAQPAEPMADEREGMDMLYSSGTTGRPKGIRRALTGHPFGAPDAIALMGSMMWGFTADSVYLSPAPMYHSAPLRFCMAVQRLGATAIVMEHFDPTEMLALIAHHRVTNTQVVPTMFVRMLKLPETVRDNFDVSSLVSVIHAAAPCPVPVKRQMIEWWGPKLFEYYAGTEGNGFVHCTSEEWLAHPGTVGHALAGTVHIVGDEGEELSLGEPGVIYFEGGGDFEYYNDPEKTAASRHPKGWSTLGDIGYLDADGYLYLTDRKANMIISGGVNIYPQEAENVLTMHPKVVDVAVFGIPNDDFGEEVKAVVQPVDMATAGPGLERELIAFCRNQLADVKCPRTIDFREELPRHPTGKLYKRLLKDEYWKGHQSRIL